MAILGKLIREKEDHINFRSGDVVGDVIIERDSKQNIQFTKEKAREFRDLLNVFFEIIIWW